MLTSDSVLCEDLKIGSSIPTLGSSIVPKPVIEITSNKITYFWRLDKGYLEREYIENGKSMAQIAREKGCARSTVSSTISSWGLEVASQNPQYHRGQLAFRERVKNGKVVPHKAELRILDEIRDRRNEGASFGQIVDWLNSQKIPTKNRVKRWDRPTVYKILKRQIIGTTL